MRTISRDIVGAFIFSKDEKILLGKSISGGVYKDCWIVPGGGIDVGESQIDALKREVLEEVGIYISNSKIQLIDGALTGESEKVLRDTNEKVLVKMTFYNYQVIMAKKASEITINCDDDFTGGQWFSAGSLGDMRLSDPTRVTLRKIGFLK